MKAPVPGNRGLTLLECLVYIAVLAVLMRLLGPAFTTASQVTAASREILDVVRHAEAVTEVIRSDVRQAVEVVTPAADAGPEHARLIVRFADGTGAAYFLREGSLIRYEVPRGHALAEAAAPGEDWEGRALPGEVERLDVSPLAGAERVFRVDLAFSVPALRTAWQGSRADHARFATAAHQLPVEAP